MIRFWRSAQASPLPTKRAFLLGPGQRDAEHGKNQDHRAGELNPEGEHHGDDEQGDQHGGLGQRPDGLGAAWPSGTRIKPLGVQDEGSHKQEQDADPNVRPLEGRDFSRATEHLEGQHRAQTVCQPKADGKNQAVEHLVDACLNLSLVAQHMDRVALFGKANVYVRVGRESISSRPDTKGEVGHERC